MKKELLDILACPACKGELKLTVEEENETEVVSGSLFCPRCDENYRIIDSIPNLLPPETSGKSGLDSLKDETRDTTEPPTNRSELKRQLADQLATVFIVALLCCWLAVTRPEVDVPTERGPWLPWLIASVLLFSWVVYRRKNIRWPKLRWVLPFTVVAFLWLMYLIIGFSFPAEFFIGLAILFLICTALLLLVLGLITTKWEIKGKLGKAITWVTKQRDAYRPLLVLVVFASIFLGWRMLLDAGVGDCWTTLFLWGGVLVFLVVGWVYLSTSHSVSSRN